MPASATASPPLLLAALLGLGTLESGATKLSMRLHVRSNPIRKVIGMLEMMQKKVEEEGLQREKLFDNFMCYCHGGTGDLQKSIAAANDRIPQLESTIKEAKGMQAQLQEELKQHNVEREEWLKAKSTAIAMKDQTHANLDKEVMELKTNVKALAKAISAVKKGSAGTFLQTGLQNVLQKLSASMAASATDRDVLTSFLEGGQQATQQGEVLGILEQMYESMEADLQKVVDQAASFNSQHEALVASQTHEISALSESIRDKTRRDGELAVKVATLKNDLEDTKETLVEDQQFVADLETSCKVKEAEWAEYQKMEAQEMVALSETIKLLNDDAALDLFKDTLISHGQSLLQVQVSSREMRQQAVSVLRTASHVADPKLDLIEMAVRGEKEGFDKLVEKIDLLVALLKEEQKEDDDKKGFCTAEIDKTEDAMKQATREASDKKAVIAESDDLLQELNTNIQALMDGIKALDEQVAEATATRKLEHAESVDAMSANSAAKSLLEIAKNKLFKFYNKKLHKDPNSPKTEEDRIVANFGGTMVPTADPGGIQHTGVSAFTSIESPFSFLQAKARRADLQARIGEEPEANMAYSKKSEEHGGVIAMLDMLREDLVKKITELELEEKDAQADYEKFVKDSADKRALDAKTVADKRGAKAELESTLHENHVALESFEKNVVVTKKELAGLHLDCDFLLEHYELRKQARADEADALQKAKSVLSGADLGF